MQNKSLQITEIFSLQRVISLNRPLLLEGPFVNRHQTDYITHNTKPRQFLPGILLAPCYFIPGGAQNHRELNMCDNTSPSDL
jgi:hypothetical protein